MHLIDGLVFVPYMYAHISKHPLMLSMAFLSTYRHSVTVTDLLLETTFNELAKMYCRL
jgi:hypothetical protein